MRARAAVSVEGKPLPAAADVVQGTLILQVLGRVQAEKATVRTGG